MKEIKFRAWDKDEKKMVYKNVPETFYNYFPEFIMQFTGLKDKNGKEIYEGDIVQWQAGFYKAKRNQNMHDTIVFEEGTFKTQKYSMFVFTIANQCEVIGNIFENPDLITKGEK